MTAIPQDIRTWATSDNQMITLVAAPSEGVSGQGINVLCIQPYTAAVRPNVTNDEKVLQSALLVGDKMPPPPSPPMGCSTLDSSPPVVVQRPTFDLTC